MLGILKPKILANQSKIQKNYFPSSNPKYETLHFGYSLAISSKILAVGAPKDNANGSNSGAVYIYNLADGNLENIITASDGAPYDYFGSSIALYRNTLAVGAHQDDDKGSGSGSVYLYDLGKNKSETKIAASDGEHQDNFGYSIALFENTLAVGAPKDDDKSPNSGAVYLYDLAKNNEETKLTASDAASHSHFGNSLALSETTIAIGAYEANSKKKECGAVYLYNLADRNTETKITASDGERHDYFGYSVALSKSTLAVGAPEDDDKGPNSGAVYLYKLSKGYSETKITAPDGTSYEDFGLSVSLTVNTLAVGAPEDNDKGKDSGAVYLFNLAKGILESKIIASDANIEDFFGKNIALSGKKLSVGAYKKNSGAVYFYDLGNSAKETKITPASRK